MKKYLLFLLVGVLFTPVSHGRNTKTDIIDFRKFFKYKVPRIDDVFLLYGVKVWDAKYKRLIKVNGFKLTIVNPLSATPSK